MPRPDSFGTCAWLALAVALSMAPTAAAQTMGAGELRTFTLQKPDRGPGERDRSAGDHPTRLPPSPPPPQRLYVTTALGYVQGADWGGHVTGVGRLGPIWLNADGLVTAGGDRTRLDRGRLSIGADTRPWTFDAGDLFSPLAGPGRGLRGTWNTSRSHHTSVTYLVPAFPSARRTPLVAVRNEMTLGRVATVDGSVATTGAHMAQVQLRLGRGSIDGTYRRLSGGDRDLRAAADVRIWRGITLRGGLARSHRDGRADVWSLAAIRIPIAAFLDVTFERTFGATPGVRRATWATLAHVTAGALDLAHRHQWGALAYDIGGYSTDLDLRQTRSTASYRAGTHLRIALQMTGQWMADGRIRLWDELDVTWKPARATTLSVAAAVPEIADAGRLRVRLSQELPWSLGVDVEFGRPSPYQLATPTDRLPRVRALVRRRWSLPAPGVRRSVVGEVVDQLGRPVGGVRVRLGRYSVDADAHGRFAFAEVAAGSYDLALDASTLPADYGWNGRPISLDLRGGTTVSTTLEVAPLDTITGRVCLDADRDGGCGPDDGLAGVTLRLDGDRTTSTDEFGRFAFYNLWPGAHRVTLERDSLGPAYLPIGRVGANVTIGPDSPVTGLTFLVAPRARPVQWSDLAP